MKVLLLLNLPESVRVRYLDENSQPQEIAADGLLATAIAIRANARLRGEVLTA